MSSPTPTSASVSNGAAPSVLLDAGATGRGTVALVQANECNEAQVLGASAPPPVSQLQRGVSDGGTTESMTTTTMPLPHALLVQTTAGSQLFVMPTVADSTSELTRHLCSPYALDVNRL